MRIFSENSVPSTASAHGATVAKASGKAGVPPNSIIGLSVVPQLSPIWMVELVYNEATMKDQIYFLEEGSRPKTYINQISTIILRV